MRPTFRTLKIEDATALRALVVEHVGSLEAGLERLDERVLLGGGSVDLVARDAGGRLVLVAVAFVADDAMLLSMLEAFAWCVEYPDTLGRLYPGSPSASGTPPRVMFVSERMSDAFLRKVKYLRLPWIDCFESRYLEVNGVAGLYFNPVDSSNPPAPVALLAATAPPAAVAPLAATAPLVDSTPPVAPVVAARIDPVIAEPAPEPHRVELEPPVPASVEPVVAAAAAVAPAAPVLELVDPPAAAEPVVRTTPRPVPDVTRPTAARPLKPRPAEARPVEPRPADARSVELLKGLRIPSNLSSQWQRILNRAAEAPDPAKTRLVREYLQAEFPACTVSDFYEHKRTAQMFQVQNGQGVVLHTAAVADDFFDAKAEGEIRPFLDRERVARALREAGASGVLITAAGLRPATD